ncbi:hypothetical protein J6590_023388 [Homalodisca vitripennis]|nr:hypothetical protein J6590_023388 [Homalodisca vitripennis]
MANIGNIGLKLSGIEVCLWSWSCFKSALRCWSGAEQRSVTLETAPALTLYIHIITLSERLWSYQLWPTTC